MIGFLETDRESWDKVLRLIHFRPMVYFYTPRIRQRTSGFLRFLGGMEMELAWNGLCGIWEQLQFNQRFTEKLYSQLELD